MNIQTDINAETDVPRGGWTPIAGAAIDWDFVRRKYWWGGAEKLEANFTAWTLGGGVFDPVRGLLMNDTTPTTINLALAGLGTFIPGACAAAMWHQSAPASTKLYFQMDNATNAERWVVSQPPTLPIQHTTYVASVVQAILGVGGATTTALNTRHGVAFSYATNDGKGAANGVAATQDTVMSLPAAPTILRLRQITATGAPTGWISRIVIFSAVKTQAELNALSLVMRDSS